MNNKLLIGAIIILSIILFILKFSSPQKFPVFPSSTSSTVPASSTSQATSPPPFPAQLPSGFAASVFADDLGNPRDLEFSPGGTLLVSLPNQNKVVALPNTNNDGQVDKTVEVLKNLNKPHGLAFYQGKLFVAELTSVKRYSWNENTQTATFEKELFELPYNGGHSTRSLVFDNKGQLFVTLGSSCNVCDEKHDWLASVIVSDSEGNSPRIFANGLRNSVFLTINPVTNELWAGDMGRDSLGDDIPSEEINIIRDSDPSTSLRTRNYGWPICYGQKIHDANFDKNEYVEDPCLFTQAPIFEFQAHSAPLGLTFINSSQFPKDWQGDLLVSYHGSWNRSTPTGYKIVRMNVEGNSIKGVEDFLTGFVPKDTKNGPTSAYGRPVDVIFDKEGSLFISDDKAGMVYKITKHN